jgi:predicted tellurium resistance membrane protein TerC
MELLFSPEMLFILVTLTFLEIILGIDNIIFIALAIHKLPTTYRRKARFIGISLALLMRIAMLLMLSWILGMTSTLFTIGELPFSVNNILLIVGGLFLIVKAGSEIYSDAFGKKEAPKKDEAPKVNVKSSFFGAVIQIALVDFVFSFDSIITAIGITRFVPVIVIAVVISMIVMLVASDYISRMLHKHPSLKIMALAFIFMIGVILLADGIHLEISKGNLYFSLFFATTIEYFNILVRKKENLK